MGLRVKALERAQQQYQGWTLDTKSGILTPKGLSRDTLVERFKKTAMADAPAGLGRIVLPEGKSFKPDEKLEIAGIANENTVDRMDDRLEPAGCDLRHFMKNSVLLYQHQHAWPIGLVAGIAIQDDGVKFEAWIGDPKAAPLTDLQRDVRSYVAQRILKAVSVGFIPLEIRQPTFNDQGDMVEGWVILRWELLELSVVAVPANPGSLFEQRAAGQDLPAPRKSFPAPAVDATVKHNQSEKGASVEEQLKALASVADSILAGIKDISENQKGLVSAIDKLQAPGAAKADDDKKPKEDPKDPKDDGDEDDKKRLAALETKLAATTDSIGKLTDAVGKMAEVFGKLAGEAAAA